MTNILVFSLPLGSGQRFDMMVSRTEDGLFIDVDGGMPLIVPPGKELVLQQTPEGFAVAYQEPANVLVPALIPHPTGG